MPEYIYADKVSNLLELPIKQGKEVKYVIPCRNITWPDGEIRIEYYHDLENPDNPVCYSRLRERSRSLYAEKDYWKSIVVDTMTSCEMAARAAEEKIIMDAAGADSKYAKGAQMDGRTPFGASTDAMEKFIVRQLGGFPGNVLVNLHVDESKKKGTGELLRGPAAPGRLTTKGELSAFYAEQYRIYVGEDEDKNHIHRLQTCSDGEWNCASQIDAPNPCMPSYSSLWTNCPEQVKDYLKYLHILLYGYTGSGKSTFAATLPKPMLVIHTDALGKDVPYLKMPKELVNF